MKTQIFNYSFSYTVFQALIYFLLIKINNSAPLNSSITYANFLKEIQHDNCVFPEKVFLPFNSNATFEYLEVHIKICTPSEEKKLKRSREATKICSDIFNILKNITCHSDAKAQLPEIKVEFSKTVCADIGSLEFPPKSEILLKHLKDRFVCDMMCDEEFNPACQVLLWSYEVQQQINNAVMTQKKNEVDSGINSAGPESTNLEVVQDKDAAEKAETSPADKSESSNNVDPLINYNKVSPADKSENSNDFLPPNNKKVSPADKSENSNDFLPPNNKTISSGVNLTKPNVEPITHSEKDKVQSIPEETSELKENTNVENKNTDVKNQEQSKSPKEKEISQQSSTPEDVKVDKENQNLINVEELSVKHNEIPSDNLEKASILNKNKQSDSNDKKLSPANTDIDDETRSKAQNIAQSKLPETAKSNKNETKIMSQMTTNIEISNVGKTVSETKDLYVMPENIKNKETKISTLKIEKEKVGVAVEVENQNIISESSTKEANNVEDVSPITTAADLEKMEDGIDVPEPSDKNPESYNEMENEGDYSKLDYDDADDGFYDSSKNKKTDLVEDSKMPVVESQNELPKYDVYQPRNSIGHGVEDIQVIPAFPEQEDSHFFFYFLSIVLILMGGYLVFHNKQKIIALIVEGRHERRRRSHGVGYKKLETK